MNKFLKLYRELMGKGFATAAEKARLKTLAGEVNDATVTDESVADVEALPENDDATVEAETKSMVKKLIDDGVEEATEKAAKKFEKELDLRMAAHKDAMEKKAGLYAPSNADARKGINEKTRNIVKAVISNDVAMAKSLGTTPDAYAGYLVDTELATEIERLATEYGVARREMRLVTLSKHDMRIPVSLTDISVYWTAERAAKTSTQPTFSQVTLSLSKIAAIVPMTDEFIEDVEFDIFGYIADVAAEKIAQKEDLAFFTGDGSGSFGGFTGLLESGDVGEVIMDGSTFASLTADDLLDLVDATPQGGLVNGKFYMHRSIRSIVRKLKDADGAYIYQRPSETGPATIWGYPVVEVEVFPTSADSAADTPFVLFGNLRKAAWVGVKSNGLSMMLSNQATVGGSVEGEGDINLFEQDMTALRIVERIGYVAVLPLAVTKLTTGPVSA